MNTLEVVGASMQFAAVVVGALALKEEARPVRNLIKVIAAAVPTMVFFVIGAVAAMLVITLAERLVGIIPWYAAPPFIIGGIGVTEALKRLGNASDEALTRVLRVMVPVFGVGVLLQLIAAATQ